MKSCSKCNTVLPDAAKFCLQCGTPVNDDFKDPQTGTFLDYNQDLAPQLSTLFFKQLDATIKNEQDVQKSHVYSERIYTTGFRDILDIHIAQLSTQIPDLPKDKIKKIVTKEFDHLIDLFLIHHCNDINKIKLPETILKYQQTTATKALKYAIIIDFLDFSNEKETVYLDFSTMPEKKFKNVTAAFLNPSNLEKIVFICDQSLLGNGKSGFAMTDEALYWKSPYKKANKVSYSDIQAVQKTEDWITINGQFFNASPSLNLKMMRLLKKLAE